MATPQSKYVAFISYSHADEAWGRWLHKALEGYRVPARLVGQESPVGPIPSKLFPVFRDRDELATAHELGSEIEKALAASASLIVICSPRAATSRWVNEEVRRYKALGRVDRVFCLIVDGEPGDAGRECFPDAVRFQVDADGTIIDRPAEPIAADVRAGKDTRARRQTQADCRRAGHRLQRPQATRAGSTQPPASPRWPRWPSACRR